MAQVFLVLKCFSCETFQVSQVKKSNKWICKICNEKQSITKVYGTGSSADCRKHVQKLNLARGEKDAAERMYPTDEYIAPTSSQDHKDSLGSDCSLIQMPVLVTSVDSRWTMYCDQTSEPDEDVDGEGPFTTERAVYDVCEVTNKRRKKKDDRGTSAYTPPNDQSHDLIGEGIPEDVTEGNYRKLDTPKLPDVDTTTPRGPPLNSRPYHREEISQIKTDISQYEIASGGHTKPLTPSNSQWSKYVLEQKNTEEPH